MVPGAGGGGVAACVVVANAVVATLEVEPVAGSAVEVSATIWATVVVLRAVVLAVELAADVEDAEVFVEAVLEETMGGV